MYEWTRTSLDAAVPSPTRQARSSHAPVPHPHVCLHPIGAWRPRPQSPTAPDPGGDEDESRRGLVLTERNDASDRRGRSATDPGHQLVVANGGWPVGGRQAPTPSGWRARDATIAPSLVTAAHGLSPVVASPRRTVTATGSLGATSVGLLSIESLRPVFPNVTTAMTSGWAFSLRTTSWPSTGAVRLATARLAPKRSSPQDSQT